ncbi:hypothetical protein FA95DRAFT_1556079 [Auriscalpium vulgare]|uniref:Uncharacterized protein n=1 Tax=Auriscalpium vulgare TaxID=40419 RepID=A0ACB8S189_9AGAM|nr:hypothetical protein FA95DRAFT_1556079 [Auriscalpium vulgare]
MPLILSTSADPRRMTPPRLAPGKLASRLKIGTRKRGGPRTEDTRTCPTPSCALDTPATSSQAVSPAPAQFRKHKPTSGISSCSLCTKLLRPNRLHVVGGTAFSALTTPQLMMPGPAPSSPAAKARTAPHHLQQPLVNQRASCKVLNGTDGDRYQRRRSPEVAPRRRGHAPLSTKNPLLSRGRMCLIHVRRA